MTELETHEPSVIAAPADVWTVERIDLIRRQLAPQASDAELEFFLATAKRTGLDPFARQIYLVPRRAKVSGQWVEKHDPMVSIDGFRLIAQRSGEYEGQVGPQWCGPDGVWRDVWLADEPPAAARVGVMRRGFREPVWSTARFAAYAQTTRDGSLTAMWARMGDHMIAKCAEALGLRRAFPAELSGLYTREEMGQAHADVIHIDAEPAKSLVPGDTPAAFKDAEERRRADIEWSEEWYAEHEAWLGVMQRQPDAQGVHAFCSMYAEDILGLTAVVKKRLWTRLMPWARSVGLDGRGFADYLQALRGADSHDDVPCPMPAEEV